MAAERRNRQGGPRASGIANGVAAAVRRRQRDRGPRVLLYSPSGMSRAVWPSEPGFDELISIAERVTERLDESDGTEGLRERAMERRRRRDSA